MRRLTDPLHTKLDMIRIVGYRSANFVGSPIARRYRMVSHVVAESG
jgi:hypothetical protein